MRPEQLIGLQSASQVFDSLSVATRQRSCRFGGGWLVGRIGFKVIQMISRAV
jgi:hypothetical protein